MLVGCSIHGGRDSKKYATVYSRWSEDATTWIRLKQKYCAVAYTGLKAWLGVSDFVSSSNVFACTACGKDCSQAGIETYLTIFVPGREQQDYALLTCLSCTKPLRESLQVNAEIPIDRGAGVGALGPNNTPDPWSDVS